MEGHRKHSNKLCTVDHGMLLRAAASRQTLHTIHFVSCHDVLYLPGCKIIDATVR